LHVGPGLVLSHWKSLRITSVDLTRLTPRIYWADTAPLCCTSRSSHCRLVPLEQSSMWKCTAY